MELANEGIMVDKRTINKRLLEKGLKSYRPMRKPRLTQKMKQARNINGLHSMKIGHQRIGPK